MKYELNMDVAKWLDAVRGKLSRQTYITVVLKQEMLKHTSHTQGQNETTLLDGATHALSQIE